MDTLLLQFLNIQRRGYKQQRVITLINRENNRQLTISTDQKRV